jgi:hypothetical protein
MFDVHRYQLKRTAKRRGTALTPCQLMASFFIALSGMTFAQTDLLVCLPGKQNTQLLQSCFDTLIGQSHSIVFGRIKDLEATFTTTPGAVIIAFAPLFDYLPGYTSVLVGKNKNAAGEKYFIVTASKEITGANIAEKKVGIVDLLFKGNLQQFVKNEFNVEIKSLKRVNKEEDLLTMLGLEAVDAIIVSSAQYKEILSNTKLPLQVVATSKNEIGFAVCAAKNGKIEPALKKSLLKSSKLLLREIGIDSWETP